MKKYFISAGKEYCVCKVMMNMNDSTADSTMVGCDRCDNFFHLSCIGLKKVPWSKIWYCSDCVEGEGKIYVVDSLDHFLIYFFTLNCVIRMMMLITKLS